MARSSFRFRMVLALAVVLVGMPTVVTVASIVDTRPTSVRAREWVAAHAKSLPTTLEEISAYPVQYRRAIFRALPPDLRSDLWREQVAAFAQQTVLNGQQQAFIRRLLPQLSPDAF